MMCTEEYFSSGIDYGIHDVPPIPNESITFRIIRTNKFNKKHSTFQTNLAMEL